MSPEALLAGLFLYLGLLFLLARLGEERGGRLFQSPWTYTLSLGVYATAWTFFGSAGWAATSGPLFLTIYLGPTLALALWPLLHLRLLRLARAHRLTSWADFLYLRYGRDPLLGAVAAGFLVLGLLPYLALQLKAIAQAFLFLSGEARPLGDVALYTALLLAFFTVLFGTRRLDPTERHRGLVLAVAFEGGVKLFAMLALGLYALLGHGAEPFREAVRRGLDPLLLPPQGLEGHLAWTGLTFLALLAFLFLPRQFHVAVVENTDERHLALASWAFPLYLLLLNLPILPLALLGRLHHPEVPPDLYVLAVAREGGAALAFLAFLGGVSAATAMVVVETLALSILVSHHLLAPLLLRRQALGHLLLFRRGTVLAVLLLAYLYFRLAGEAYALVGMGLISFVAVAQLAPAGLLGLFWQGSTREGALAGLFGGILVWAYTLLLPALVRSGWLPQDLFAALPSFLHPEGLFGVRGLDPVVHGFLASLLANTGLHLLVSLRQPPSPPPSGRAGEEEALADLLEKFLGPEARESLKAYARTLKGPDKAERLAERAEALLAGALGPATARLLLLSATREVPREAVEAAARESQRVRAYAQALEAARRELEAAYRRLEEMDRLKDEFLATVSHELKTPLTAVRALAEILAPEEVGEEERRRFTALLAQEAARLSRLVEEILAYTRLEARPEEPPAPVDLEALAREALALSEPLARERGLRLEARLQPLRVRTHRDRALQVLLNLLANALRHARSRVVLELRAEAGEARFRVVDDGPGVPEALREHIFAPFQSYAGGTGLGLAIARRLSEALGGRVFLEDGEGGVFVFALPLEGDHGRGADRGR